MPRIVMEGVVTPGTIARLEFEGLDVEQVIAALAQMGFRRGMNGPVSPEVSVTINRNEPATVIAPAPKAEEKKETPPPAVEKPAKKKEEPPKEEPPKKDKTQLSLVSPGGGAAELPLDKPAAEKPSKEAPPAEEKKPAAEKPKKVAAEEKTEKPGNGAYELREAMELKRLRDVVEFLIEHGIKDPEAVQAECRKLVEEHGHKALQRTPEYEKRAKALAEAAAVED